MSVLIKGMEMPISCWEDDCPCLNKQYGFCQADDDKGFVYSNKPEWCPLVPVPPHGDLIERDAAYDKIAEQEGGNYVDMDVVDMGLNETPTIIPAEECE